MGRKRVINKSDIYRSEFIEYNKRAKADGLYQLQFKTIDDYIAYREGRSQKVSKVFKPMLESTIKGMHKQEIKQFNSKTGSNNQASTEKKESMWYNGNYIIGIATMHKSNLVPVTRDGNPAEYSTMRRS
jgi:hypothetical protein